MAKAGFDQMNFEQSRTLGCDLHEFALQKGMFLGPCVLGLAAWSTTSEFVAVDEQKDVCRILLVVEHVEDLLPFVRTVRGGSQRFDHEVFLKPHERLVAVVFALRPQWMSRVQTQQTCDHVQLPESVAFHGLMHELQTQAIVLHDSPLPPLRTNYRKRSMILNFTQ